MAPGFWQRRARKAISEAAGWCTRSAGPFRPQRGVRLEAAPTGFLIIPYHGQAARVTTPAGV
eukprot:1013495-Alexandrium_andersonii.AAC.1